jgi:16S rRNA (uracil1498-N3)-methyltransferase
MSLTQPRYRLAVDAALAAGASVTLSGNAAHYLTTVLRLSVGDGVALFNRDDGQWHARIADIRKKELTLTVETCMRPAVAAAFHLTVCFAPIKGGRMETIIEKATELGAQVLQPVLTARSIVDKVNLERAEAIAREAAEQCERIDWPVIRPPVKLINLLGDWPNDLPLIYGDESGDGTSIASLIDEGGLAPLASLPPAASAQRSWAILAGPEGGFTVDEFVALRRIKSARGVGLGPRILRADTAVITLCVATLMAWGDWDHRPRFIPTGES